MSGDGERNNEVLLRGGNKDNIETFRERRRKSDWLVKAAILMSVLALMSLFAVWIVLDYAAENRANFFNYYFGVEVPENPLTYTLIPIAYGLLLATLGICVIAFVFNKMRMRRKTDKYRKSIFIIGGITIVALVLFLINFWNVLY